MMNSAQSDLPAPTVSIGLAVYNGERYLRQAIESILAQTYTDFELILSDNASTDRTDEICREYEKADPRVSYHRNETNIGGANNENQTFLLARGRYFRWAAHDDLLSPTLLERCVQVMEADPRVVVSHPWTIVIDENGHEIGRRRRDRPLEMSRAELFESLADARHDCEETYGLMRADALSATGLQRNYTDSDRTLLAHLALLGNFVEVPEYLFFKRVHANSSTAVFSEWRGRMAWFGQEHTSALRLPFWAQYVHYLQIVTGAPIEGSTRLRCYAYLALWPTKYRRWRSLGKDLMLALTEMAHRLVHRGRA